MRKRTKVVLATAGVLLLATALLVVPTLWFRPYSANHQYTRIFATFALRSPMLLSQLQFLPGWLDFHSDDLDDRSLAFQDRQQRWLERELGILRSYRRASVGDTLSHDILEWFMADAADGSRWRFHGYPLNQTFGEQSNLPSFMLETHRIERLRDARTYVARLEQFERYYDQVIEGVRERADRGVVPPRFVMQRVLAEMREFIEPPVTEHVLYTHLRTRLDALADVRPRDRDAVLARAEAALSDRVYPAYGRLIAQAEQMENIATTDDGVWRLPDGAAYYDYLLRQHTTTDLTAEQVHETGLREVARIEAEMRAILAVEGYAPGADIGPALSAVYREPRFQWPDSEEGRAAILAEYQRINDEIDAGIGALFGIRPRAPVRVERIPQFKEATSPLAYYNSPALDGSRPGTFYANLRTVEEHAKPRMRTLTYHEATPGHHFQIAIAQELQGVPFFRRVIPFTAYTEGWALYAEQVAAEHGFQDDPYSRLGYLTDQMLRACRLVVDTGIHAKRWTREQAIAYMLSKTGMPEQEVTAEVERYIVWPGQATAYMVGRLKILELRERAQQRLGDRFELREFHDVVLRNGSVPLVILERIVEDWLAARG
jgi:uncharacterized protein (DUF885 family)